MVIFVIGGCSTEKIEELACLVYTASVLEEHNDPGRSSGIILSRHNICVTEPLRVD
jgi:hypothetical protein